MNCNCGASIGHPLVPKCICKPLESTPSVEEITYVINLLGLNERDVIYRQIATLAWTRAFKKASEK